MILCMFKLNIRLFVPINPFNLYVAAERGRPRQIEWLTFMASGPCSQTEMSYKSKGTSTLINYSSVREIKFFSSGQRGSRLWNEGSFVCWRMTGMIFKFWRVCLCSPIAPQKCRSHSCLVSTWNLAGCDCAEKGNTFQAYHGVRGLEEPIGGQLTAQSLLPAPTQNKKALSRKKKSLRERGGGGSGE